jgi:DNA repair protein SbcD/Mre11
MKTAVTADLHLRTRDRTPERYGALENILAQLKSEDIDSLVIAGDLFDHDFHNYSDFEAVCRAHPGVTLHIIPGNHDPGISEQQIVGENVHIYTKTTPVEIGSALFLFIPFLAGARMGEQIADQAEAFRERPWVLVAHGDYYGGVREANPLEPGTYMPLSRQDVSRFEPRTVFLGHIHKPSDMGCVHYAGSPCGLDITETGKRRFFLYDTSDDTLEARAVITDALYFQERFVVVPTADEVDILRRQISERITSWNLDPSDPDRVRVRVKVAGYATDRSAIVDVLQEGFAGYQFFADEVPDIGELSSSDDPQLSAIAGRTLELIDNMGGELGDDGPALEQVVMKALYTIYET